MLRLCGGSSVTSRSPKWIEPEEGWMKPPSKLSSVVLPEPEGPSSETNSRGTTWSETLSSTRTLPKLLLADLISTLSPPLPNERPSCCSSQGARRGPATPLLRRKGPLNWHDLNL